MHLEPKPDSFKGRVIACASVVQKSNKASILLMLYSSLYFTIPKSQKLSLLSFNFQLSFDRIKFPHEGYFVESFEYYILPTSIVNPLLGMCGLLCGFV